MIVTFYSYKGGVGRSMALANVADLLARSGLQVLIVDFDLEAPGLETFFPVDHDDVRAHEGLLDLLLTFKYAMSTASSGSEERDAFRRLDRFVTTVYPAREGGGGLDLLPAGSRLTDDQIGRYGEELRRFDWLDFYFSWSGELFFEWLRKTFAERYDAVLVDSRTGVTEMGGVCAYQLADAIVALCAPNLQNLDGTDAMVRHFLSPQVRAVRGDRPLDVLVVPARVDQEDSTLRQSFQERFQNRFAALRPVALADAGLSLWDLQIPYEPRYAFDEQVVTDPRRTEERRGLAGAYGTLLQGIALLAAEGSRLARLRPAPAVVGTAPPQEPVETRYDPTMRFAPVDAFISFGLGSEATAEAVRVLLVRQKLEVATSPDPTAQDAAYTRASSELARVARLGLVLVGPAGDRSRWRQREIEQLVTEGRPVLPVLLPGADPALIPVQLHDHLFLVFEPDGENRRLLDWIMAALAAPAGEPTPLPRSVERNPYPGMLPFQEQDGDVFAGREVEIEAMLDRLRADGCCSVVGPAGAGKSSAVFARLVPALRRGALPGSERWPVVSIRAGERPAASLIEAVFGLAGLPADDDVVRRTIHAAESQGAGTQNVWVGEDFPQAVLVVDQFEELFMRTPARERDRFVALLTDLCHGQPRRITTIVIVRADFLSQAASLPNLDLLFQDHVDLEPLSGDDLRAAIELPARRLGLAFEPGLVDRLLADVAGQPGAMPLLQFVLHKLWQDQQEGFVTHASYDRMGGAGQVLASRAGALLEGLAPKRREVVRRVFLRLVEAERGRPRRGDPVELDELVSGVAGKHIGAAEARSEIELLVEQRLLAMTMTADGPPTIAIAHEGLLEAWPALRSWIQEELEAIEARSRLAAAASDWHAQEGDEAALLSPERVNQLLWQIGSQPLSAQERAYVAASRQHAKATHDRTNRRTRRTAVASTVLGILVVVPLASTMDQEAAIGFLTVVVAVAGLVGLGALIRRWRRRR